MDAKVIIYFSKEKENLSQFLKFLPQVFGYPVNCLQFHSWKHMFQCIKELNSKNKTILFLLDVQDSSYNSISYLDEFNDLTPDSVKIITSKKEYLIEIQKRIKNRNNLQYLAKPCDLTDLILAFEVAKQTAKKNHLIHSKNKMCEELMAKVEKKGIIKINQATENEHDKDKMFSIIAHDLKTPFSALLGLSEILLNNWDSLPEKDKYEISEDIRNTSKETFQLLQDLLLWTKSQKTKITVCPEQIQVQDILKSIIAIEKENAQLKNISIINKIENDVYVYVDKFMISTVFRNLISNAIKFIPEGSRIAISANREGSDFTFYIKDNGNGINKPFILKLFKQNIINNKITEECRINGLGLLLCKEFVERNHGKIWLETEKGKGSTFYFTIPAVTNFELAPSKRISIHL